MLQALCKHHKLTIGNDPEIKAMAKRTEVNEVFSELKDNLPAEESFSRSRAGPAKFLEGYKGYLQADAYSVYDAFFKPQRGMTEVGCWMHARRYVFKALESDEPHMGPALHLIARLYRVEERAKALSLSADERLALRQRVSARLIEKPIPAS
jgi:hypothetical protein